MSCSPVGARRCVETATAPVDGLIPSTLSVGDDPGRTLARPGEITAGASSSTAGDSFGGAISTAGDSFGGGNRQYDDLVAAPAPSSDGRGIDGRVFTRRDGWLHKMGGGTSLFGSTKFKVNAV